MPNQENWQNFLCLNAVYLHSPNIWQMNTSFDVEFACERETLESYQYFSGFTASSGGEAEL